MNLTQERVCQKQKLPCLLLKDSCRCVKIPLYIFKIFDFDSGQKQSNTSVLKLRMIWVFIIRFILSCHVEKLTFSNIDTIPFSILKPSRLSFHFSLAMKVISARLFKATHQLEQIWNKHNKVYFLFFSYLIRKILSFILY